jgi:spore coat protein U-like protein
MRIHLSSAFAGLALCFGASSSLAATATGSFTSQLIITDECTVQSASNLNFGSDGFLNAVINQTSTIGVVCTNLTGYTISLDDGSGTGTTAVRTMENVNTEDVTYTMSKDAGHTQNWGDTGGEIMTALTGNGALQNYTVYGQVPIQATPTPATYTDTVTVTVTYP